MVLKTSLWQVGYMDEVVGNVTTQLKEKGMWDNVSAQNHPAPFSHRQAVISFAGRG